MYVVCTNRRRERGRATDFISLHVYAYSKWQTIVVLTQEQIEIVFGKLEGVIKASKMLLEAFNQAEAHGKPYGKALLELIEKVRAAVHTACQNMKEENK